MYSRFGPIISQVEGVRKSMQQFPLISISASTYLISWDMDNVMTRIMEGVPWLVLRVAYVLEAK